LSYKTHIRKYKLYKEKEQAMPMMPKKIPIIKIGIKLLFLSYLQRFSSIRLYSYMSISSILLLIMPFSSEKTDLSGLRTLLLESSRKPQCNGLIGYFGQCLAQSHRLRSWDQLRQNRFFLYGPRQEPHTHTTGLKGHVHYTVLKPLA